MKAVYLKELSVYFRGPLGYVCLGIYYLFGGQFLLAQMADGTNNVSTMFSNFYVVVLLTLPLYTMRLWAEEKRMRTEQGLLTAPIKLWEIVWAKFLAAYTLYMLGISVTIIYGSILAKLSSPTISIFLGNFIGISLLGASLIAIGLFVSSLTESQMLAAVGTFAVMMLIIGIDSISSIIPSGLMDLADIIAKLSFSSRYYNFTSGVLRIPDILFFLSIVFLFNFLTVQMLDRGRWVNTRKIRSASTAGVLTAIVFCVVALCNVVVDLLFERIPSFDLTQNKIYALSDDSKKILSSLDEEVRIVVCYNEEALRSNEYGRQTDEILRQYNNSSTNIQVQFADLLKEPEISQQYSEYGIEQGSILIRTDQRVKVISLDDCIVQEKDESGYGYSVSSKAEQELTSAIAYVTEDSVVEVSVLEGHSEEGCEDILNYLNENNYSVQVQNIATEEINESSKDVFIFAPMTDFTKDELEKLDRFLDNNGSFGKSLIYIAAYDQPELPNLEAFLEEWGLKVGSGIIVEQDSKNIYDGQGFMFCGNFTENAEKWLANVKNPSLPFIGYYCRPISCLWEEKNNRSAKELVISPDTTVLYESDNGKTTIGADESQNYGLVAIGERIKYLGTEKRTSCVVVFGSNVMFSSNAAVSTNFNNKDFVVELINSISEKKNSISIPSVSFNAPKLKLTSAIYHGTMVSLGILLPMAMAAAGIIMAFWRRRL